MLHPPDQATAASSWGEGGGITLACARRWRPLPELKLVSGFQFSCGMVLAGGGDGKPVTPVHSSHRRRNSVFAEDMAGIIQNLNLEDDASITFASLWQEYRMHKKEPDLCEVSLQAF